MLSPNDMRELDEFEEEVKKKNLSEEVTLRIVAMYSNWIERRKRNQRTTIIGLFVATLIFIQLLSGIISGQYYSFYTCLGCITVIASYILPAFDTNFGRQISLLKQEIIEINNK